MSTPIGTSFRGVEGRLGYLLRQAHQAMHGAIEREVRDLGITAPQFSLLSALRHERGVSVTELAQNSMITQQTTSEIVQALERKGLVARAADPADRRVGRLTLTAEGAEVLHQADTRVLDIERRTTEGLDPAALEHVAHWLVGCALILPEQRVPRRRVG